MQNYNWNYPTTMWVGENRIKDLGSACNKLNINKPLLVTDKGLAKSKIIEEAVTLLKKENLAVEVFSNVVGNPTGSNVDEGVEFYKNNKCDGVIAFGGGSSLDVAKFVAHKIKKFKILEEDFDQDKDELTPTFKVKRKVVIDNYKVLLDSMY